MENQEENINENFEQNEENEENNIIKNLNKELEIYKDKFLRTAAEYENFRKRTEKEKNSIYLDATALTILNILPVIDSLNLAFKSIENSSEEYKKGINLIISQLNDCFKKMNVSSFGEIGEKFDPNIHNAVSTVKDENNENNQEIITDVFQTGYKIGDRVIRHAMVQVKN